MECISIDLALYDTYKNRCTSIGIPVRVYDNKIKVVIKDGSEEKIYMFKTVREFTCFIDGYVEATLK